MPFPNHPDKYESAPIITTEKRKAYRDEMGAGRVEAMPSAVILCYSRGLMEYLTGEYDGQFVEGGYLADLYAFAERDFAIGVLGNFGIGAPVTAMLMEELIGEGVETFLSIGFAGGLDHRINVGDYIVCERAIRDEGTSHHYVESEKYAYPSEALSVWLERTIERCDIPVHTGTTWTTDAIYRETETEVEQYAEEGVLTVDMEAAAVFTVAAHHDVEAASLFVISDYLGPSDWEPKFHLSREDLDGLGDRAKELLAEYRS